MAISKRLRFEILRRDNHTCHYCGRTPPDVKLTVDHVIPESLGGTDDPKNLVAACGDCNGGKSSVPPDAALVASAAADSSRWSSAMQEAAAEMQLHDNTDVYEAVVQAWTSFRRNQIPADYRETIDQFLAAGLSATDVVAMARVADSKPSIYNRWSYFCGCCWTRIRQLQERAHEIVTSEKGEMTEPPAALTTIWTSAEIDEYDSGAITYARERIGDERLDKLLSNPKLPPCRHGIVRHCGDPVCVVEDGAMLMLTAQKLKEFNDRVSAVCAEAEALLDDDTEAERLAV